MAEWSERHPSVAHFESLFEYGHLPEPLRAVSSLFPDRAVDLLARVQDGSELSACLRKLLEAKDCAVRQAILDRSAS